MMCIAFDQECLISIPADPFTRSPLSNKFLGSNMWWFGQDLWHTFPRTESRRLRLLWQHGGVHSLGVFVLQWLPETKVLLLHSRGEPVSLPDNTCPLLLSPFPSCLCTMLGIVVAYVAGQGLWLSYRCLWWSVLKKQKIRVQTVKSQSLIPVPPAPVPVQYPVKRQIKWRTWKWEWILLDRHLYRCADTTKTAKFFYAVVMNIIHSSPFIIILLRFFI